jgi:hypothetical protein
MKIIGQIMQIARSTSQWLAVLSLASLSLSLPAASGQISPRAGEKVRVTAPTLGLEEAVGVVRDAGVGTLLIDLDQTGADVLVRAHEVERMEVALNQDSYARMGAVFGFLAGAGIGAAIGRARGDTNCPQRSWLISDCVAWSQDFKTVVGALLGGTAGAGIGTLIGKSFKKDIWQPAVVGAGSVSVSPAIGPGETGLVLGVSF